MKKRLILGLPLPALLVLMMSGCYYDVEEDLYPINNPDTLIVSYSADVEPLLNANCNVPGCHATGSGLPVFETYSIVKSHVDNGKLEDRAITIQDMPPSGPLLQSERDIIAKWILDGAEEN